MKKFLNKKTAIAAILAVALAVGSIGTYAWYLVTTDPEDKQMDLGILDYDVTGAFDVDMENYVFQPGDGWNFAGALENKGNIEMIAKATLDPTVTIKNGPKPGTTDVYDRYRPLDPAAYYESVNDPYVNVEFNEDLLGFGFVDNDNYFQWFFTGDMIDPAGDNMDLANYTNKEYYLIIYGNLGIDLDFDVMCSEEAGNKYMNAQVDFADSWTATQVRQGAVTAAWNISYADDLIPVMNDLSAPAPRPFGRSAAPEMTSQEKFDAIQANIAELMAR